MEAMSGTAGFTPVSSGSWRWRAKVQLRPTGLPLTTIFDVDKSVDFFPSIS